jgi:MFS family permease
MRHRDFRRYWVGIVLSEIGTRGTIAAVLYHVYLLTGSTVQVGLVGLAQAVALLGISPLGGAIADRMDRRRLLQISQTLSLIASATLATVTLLDIVAVWQILLVMLVNTAAGSFERPARDALIPSLVPRGELVRAFALVNPSRELAVLLGPAIAGLLIAWAGPEAMYLLDVLSYVVIIITLFFIRTPALVPDAIRPNLWSSIGEGLVFVRRRPLILQLMSLDLSATVFGAYRVILPALATDILMVGARGYGLLSAAPSAGALLGSVLIYRTMHRARAGHLVLLSTAAYGVMTLALAGSATLTARSASRSPSSRPVDSASSMRWRRRSAMPRSSSRPPMRSADGSPRSTRWLPGADLRSANSTSAGWPACSARRLRSPSEALSPSLWRLASRSPAVASATTGPSRRSRPPE